MSNGPIDNKEQNEKVSGQFVTFTLDDEIYAVSTLAVQEIIGYVKPTHVPNLPAFITGVINLRGQVIPIMNLRTKFNMTQKEHDKYSVIVILEVGAKQIGIVVDSVSDVINLNEENIKQMPQVSEDKQEYIKGMTNLGDKLVILLDIAKILSYDEYKTLHGIHHE